MATAVPEDHEDIEELQANLRRVLADWDTAGPDERDDVFARIVPATGDLVDAQQHRLRVRAEIRSDWMREWASRILLLLAVLVVAVVLVLGAGLWWALLALPLLAAGIYLRIGRAGRG